MPCVVADRDWLKAWLRIVGVHAVQVGKRVENILQLRRESFYLLICQIQPREGSNFPD